MSAQYGIVCPSELFDSEEEAIRYASSIILEDDFDNGVYVVTVETKTHLKIVKSVVAEQKEHQHEHSAI